MTQPQRSRMSGVSLVATLALAIAVCVLAVAAWVAYAHYDQTVARWCQPSADTVHDYWWFRALEQIGKTLLPLLLVAIWGTLARRWRTVLTVALALVLSGVLVWGVKSSAQRLRPFREADAQDQAMPWFGDWSFPSGDTTVAFAMATALAAYAGAGGRLTFFLLAATVGFLRVFGLYHYPSDVLAGAAVGISCGWAGVTLGRRLFRLDPPRWWPRRLAVFWTPAATRAAPDSAVGAYDEETYLTDGN